MNRRGFIQSLGVVGAGAIVMPWRALRAEELREGLSIANLQHLELETPYQDKARRTMDEATVRGVLDGIETGLSPFVSYVATEDSPAYRGWVIVATRWYRTSDGQERELGLQAILTDREMRRVTDAHLKSVKNAILDGFARTEREKGWTWNQSTLVGWA